MSEERESPNSKHPFAAVQRLDTIFLAALWLLTYPVFKLARLPYAFDFVALTTAYWIMPVGAVFVAILLGILGLPFSVTVQPFLNRLRAHKLLGFFLLFIAILLCWVLGAGIGTVVFVDSLGIAELSQRYEEQFGSKVLDLLVPAAYLFLGLIAVFAFNHAIVGIRYGGMEDAALNNLDSQIFGVNVSSIAQWGYHHLPNWVFSLFDFIYFSIWSRIGAALILVAVLGSRKDAVKFVRNILFCYTLALMVFAAVPAKGPYSISKAHLLRYSKNVTSYSTQHMLVNRMKELHAKTLTEDVQKVGVSDYFISFPSLHAALPLIMLWFLRRWRRIQLVIVPIYCLLLIPALVFLDWHYLVDIFGGWSVAIVSIVITEQIALSSTAGWLKARCAESEPAFACPASQPEYEPTL